MPSRKARKSRIRRDLVEGRTTQRITLITSRMPVPQTPNELTLPLSIFDPEEIQAVIHEAPQLMADLGQQPIAGGGGDGQNIPAIPVAIEWPMGHGALNQDVFLPLDLMTRFRMRKVNRTFKAHAEDDFGSSRQYLDVNSVIHHYWTELERMNFPATPYHYPFIWSLMTIQNKKAQDAILWRIGMLTNAFPMPPDGTIIVRFDLGLDPDGNYPVLRHSYASEFLGRMVNGLFPNANRVIFTDSCLLPDILAIASEWDNCRGRVWFVRTRFHSPDLCGHLVRPLYVHRHHLPDKHYTLPLQPYVDLMDQHMQIGDKQALRLLKQSYIRNWDYSPEAPMQFIIDLQSLKARFPLYLMPHPQDDLAQIKQTSISHEEGWLPSAVYLFAVALRQHKRGHGMPSTENVNGCTQCSEVFLDPETHDEAALAHDAAHAAANPGQNNFQNDFGDDDDFGGDGQNGELFEDNFGGGGQDEGF